MIEGKIIKNDIDNVRMLCKSLIDDGIPSSLNGQSDNGVSKKPSVVGDKSDALVSINCSYRPEKRHWHAMSNQIQLIHVLKLPKQSHRHPEKVISTVRDKFPFDNQCFVWIQKTCRVPCLLTACTLCRWMSAGITNRNRPVMIHMQSNGTFITKFIERNPLSPDNWIFMRNVTKDAKRGIISIDEFVSLINSIACFQMTFQMNDRIWPALECYANSIPFMSNQHLPNMTIRVAVSDYSRSVQPPPPLPSQLNSIASPNGYENVNEFREDDDVQRNDRIAGDDDDFFIASQAEPNLNEVLVPTSRWIHESVFSIGTGRHRRQIQNSGRKCSCIIQSFFFKRLTDALLLQTIQQFENRADHRSSPLNRGSSKQKWFAASLNQARTKRFLCSASGINRFQRLFRAAFNYDLVGPIHSFDYHCL